MIEKNKQFSTQSDVVMHVGVNAELEINKFKKEYFNCLKRRVKYQSLTGDKNKLYECIHYNNDTGKAEGRQAELKRRMNILKLSDDDKVVIKLAEELMNLQNIGSIYDFKEMFELIVSNDENNPKRQKLIDKYIEAQKEGRDLFDLDED